MNRDAIITVLKSLKCTVPLHQPRGGWVVSDCALGPWRHENGKSSPHVFGVKIGPGDPHVNCFSCGWHGSMSDLVFTMKTLNKVEPHLDDVDWKTIDSMIEAAFQEFDISFDQPSIEDLLAKKAKKHVYPEWWLNTFAPWRDVDPVRSYVEARAHPSIADILDLRADSKEMRACFPVRDFRGDLMGLHGRSINDAQEPRYRMYTYAGTNNPLIWLGESWVNFDRPIVIVEGPFDLAAVKAVYANVVSPLFANPNVDKLRRMAQALEWITLLDRGTGGDRGRERISRVMGSKCLIRHLSVPAGVKDPGEMSADQMRELLATVLPDSLINP